MNTLPLWVQIAFAVLGLLNVTSIITSILTIRQKNQELKDIKLQRINDNLLQNTRPHIDPLYIPINIILAKLESKYDEYKAARGRYYGHKLEKSLKASEDTPGSKASEELELLLYGSEYDAILAMTRASQELIDYQEKMIAEGTSAYLIADFDRRLDTFIRFLRGMMIVSHTYLLSFKDVPEGQAKIYVLGTPEFEKELYTEIDYFREYIRKLALGTPDNVKVSPN